LLHIAGVILSSRFQRQNTIQSIIYRRRKNRQKMQAPRAGKMTLFFKNGLFGGEPLGHHLGHPELMNS
jgi:hypothetical protein